MAEERKIKVCLAGESQVGKSSILRRFITGDFHDQYIMTLGAAVCKKTMSKVDRTSGKNVTTTFVIWDVMGNKDLPELLTLAYFKGARGVLLICDITRRETFDKLNRWTDMVRKVVGRVPMLVVGNKADLVDYAKVTESDLAKFAKQNRSDYILTSARTGHNIDRAFEVILERMDLPLLAVANEEEAAA
jgi:small GTP-binding protein